MTASTTSSHGRSRRQHLSTSTRSRDHGRRHCHRHAVVFQWKRTTPPTLLVACQLWLCLSFLLNINNTKIVVDAFASYMVQNIGCMTDLSTDEVIMNAPVVAAAQSDHPEVYLKLANEVDAAKVESIEGKTKYWIDTNAKHHPDHVYEDAILIELQLDYDDTVLKDLQFLVEASFGASMVGGQCDDEKRIAARTHDKVTLKLPTTTTVPIQVWAGWATGHEQVRLTPVVEFQLKPAAKREEEEEHVEEQPPPVQQPKQQQQVVTEDERKNENEMAQEFKAYKNKRRQEEGRGETSSTKNKNRSGHQKENNPRRNHRKYHGHQQPALSEENEPETEHQEPRTLHKKRNRSGKDDKKEAIVNDDTDDSRPKKNSRGGDATPQDKIKERQRKWVHNKDAIMDRVLKHSGGTSTDLPDSIQMETTWFLYGLGILLLGNIVAIKACIFVSQHKKGGSGGGEAKHV